MRKSLLGGRLSWLVFLIPMILPLVTKNTYYVHGILCQIFVFTILVTALDIIMGYLGDISLGHAGFFAVGAYAVAILTTTQELNAEGTLKFLPQLSFSAALIIAIVICAGVGAVLSFPSLRLSGDYLAATTIAYGMIIHTVINESENLTNGTKGISVPPLKLFGLVVEENHFLWVVYPVMLAVMWMVRNLAKSFWGRAFEAIKHSSIAAECCGVSRAKYKVSGFALSAALAGLAGGLFAHQDNYIGTATFSLDLSILLVIALVLGGVRSTLGNFIGMFLVVSLPDFFTGLKDYRLVAFGIVLLLTLFFLPNGLAGLFRRLTSRLFPAKDLTEFQQDIAARAANDKSPLFTSRPSNGDLVLNIQNVRKKFGGVTAVDKLDLIVRRGSIHGLMGPNGSGKSTTVNLITGLYPPSEGSIQLFDANVAKLSTARRSAKGISRTFQNLQLFGELTVLDNVLVGLHQSFKATLLSVLLSLPDTRKEEREMQVRAYRLLKFVGLEKQAFETASSLSYGQARRLEIARALGVNPTLLLLDEPAAGFSATEILELNEVIKKIKAEGIAILLIEHHMDMLLEVSDELTCLDFGRTIASGSPKEVQNSPKVMEAYLGTQTEGGTA